MKRILFQKLGVLLVLSLIFMSAVNAQTPLPAPFGMVLGYNSTGSYFTIVVGTPNPDNKTGLKAYVFSTTSSGNIGDELFSEVIVGGKLTYAIPGTYVLKIQAIGDGINYSDSPLATVGDWVIPSGPAEQLATPAISSITDGNIAFNTITNAKSYTVYVYATTDLSTPLHTQTNVVSGSKILYNAPGSYVVKVKAIGNLPYYTDSELSASFNWTISELVAIKLTKPVGVVVGYNAGTNLLTCAWGAGDSHATAYKRFIYTNGDDIVPVTTVTILGAGQGSITGFKPIPGKTYKVKMQAIGDGVAYSNSDVSSFGTAANPIPGTAPSSALDAPTNLAVSSTKVITFTASANATDYTAFVLKGSLLLDIQPGISSGSTLNYTGTPGTYSVKVRAMSDGINFDNSPLSQPASFTIAGDLPTSNYCDFIMGTTAAQKAHITFETNSAGNVIIDIAPYGNDANTAFRNDGWANGIVTAMTVNGDPNTANKYFTRSISTDKLQITLTPVSGMINAGDIIGISGVLEYKTSLDTNLWPTYVFSYIYGTSCGISTLANNSSKTNTLSVYPIPAGDVLYIKGIDAIAEIKIIDLQGKVYNATLSDDKIDISKLTKGIYVLKVVDKSGNSESLKIVK